MKKTDIIYQKLNELWWDVLADNRDISRFKDEFFTTALDDGYDLDQIEEFWQMS